MSPKNFRSILFDKVKDRYTVAEFVELIELDYDNLCDFFFNDMSQEQISVILEDMRIEDEDVVNDD